MGKYTEVRRVAAHQTLAKRHPLMTLFGGRLTMLGLAVVGLVVVQEVVTQFGWVIWTTAAVGLLAAAGWVTLWWTGRT